MFGLMQDWPLLIHKIIDFAAEQHGHQHVVTRSVEGPITRCTYKDVRLRALKLAQLLDRAGMKAGDRIATLAWNTARHMESWYGITGIGAIYHTINPRLFPEQIVWIINDAQDRMIFIDLTFVPLIEKIAPQLPSLEKIIVLTDAQNMPQSGLKGLICYEDWLNEADGDFRWASFDERTAAGLCYTSGTTGNPKGVVFSHRSNVLHALANSGPDALAVSSRSTILAVVPLFHANSWSIAFAAPMGGAKLVMPGAKLDGASIYELLENEQVTFTAGVPTVWMMLLNYMAAEQKSFSSLKRVAIGGAAAPRVMIKTVEEDYGVEVLHAWGMTEMSPLGSIGAVKSHLRFLEKDALLDLKVKQGYPMFGVEMRIVDDDNRPLPWDGHTFGRLQVRGCAVASSYFGGTPGDILDQDGYFDTGDVAHIDVDGYMQITDRSKDVIKSGGEWISSIEIENLAVGHPDVLEAAVIATPHPKWDERPLLIVVAKAGHHPAKSDILNFLRGKIASWWMPDDVQFVDEIPHTATGKINKLRLREMFKSYVLPTGDSR